ncbi:Na+/H+ antiporter subunit A [Microbacterium aurantiacum]|uniref:Na+/H+ antiporter subunit A n=1 Tax=Microbacterium aurantiacum TaxID=162393 RepID=A0ABT8FTV7_9MICO|nr:Na+/H+ antiporter subunit A [Microbacterium aurantiacum]MBN9202224.1 Na+/H+ antiporter subunit A [Microbacterium chocolatum]MDN4464756.1 Na+/H+ antiporter subunit A [Microbacterium aurantiacum]ODT11359.1 MAG: Na+/H+ antiporter subunit A [Microbacterium sp. SCN 70-18]
MLALLLAFAIVPLLLPLLTAKLGARVFLVAAALPLVAFAHAVWLGPEVLSGGVPFSSYTWIAPLGIELSMRMDLLSWLMTLIVTGVGALVMIYCRWYFRGKTDGLGQFSAVLLAFAGAMYGLVLTDDLVVLVMFWEITSVLSYLLIGYYNNRAASRRSALQALLVTTLGGLVMLIGVVLLVVESGTTSMTTMLSDAPTGMVVDVALVLVLVGALSKSAIFPFHFWLPGAMAAPTPVSAYLHAAAMVKAGIYLIARFAPVFAFAPTWRPIVIGLGVFTMLLGGFQALRETDLKRVLAFGTVSQLGFLTVILGFGTRDAALAGLALLLSHALFKSALFLIVGVIDRQLSTRDLRELSGLGRQAPVLATVSIVAICSMVGVIPTLGFVGKETALAALLTETENGSVWGLVALVGVLLGSILTAAYGARFVWGAFWSKKDADGGMKTRTEWPRPPIGFVASPLVLAGLTLVAGFAAPALDRAFALYADLSPVSSPGIPAPEYAGYLALWHGLEPALFLSLGTIAIGLVVFWLTARRDLSARMLPFTAADVYNASLRGIAQLSVWTTSLTQRGSLPIYVGTIFVVLVAAEGTALLASPVWQAELVAYQTPMQLVVAPIMIAAGLVAVRARKRYTGVVLVSVTGLGMVVIFATSGAPDLALTQILVETVTLIAFALVLRRIPSRMGDHNASVAPITRAVIGGAVGVTMGLIALVATGARIHTPVSENYPDLAYELGHGSNVVNVTLVDIRGWDTMGELSVLVLAATGVASLVFVTHRSDTLSRAIAPLPAASGRGRRPLVETSEGVQPRETGSTRGRTAWLVGGQKVRPEERSFILEVIVRILFHSIIIVSLYLLFAGHNLPGGGFAGGLVAGMALVMRYVAGGRYELGAAAPTDAGRLLGVGMTIAVACAIVPLFFGVAPLTSTWWEAEIPVFGHIEFVTSTLFDVGVYLVVIGLVLDVLRSLGAEVDRQGKQARLGVNA